MAAEAWIPRPGDVIHFVKDGVTYIRRIQGVEDRADYGYFRLFTTEL